MQFIRNITLVKLNELTSVYLWSLYSKIVRWNEIVTLLHTFLLLAIVANIYGRILNIIEKQRWGITGWLFPAYISKSFSCLQRVFFSDSRMMRLKREKITVIHFTYIIDFFIVSCASCVNKKTLKESNSLFSNARLHFARFNSAFLRCTYFSLLRMFIFLLIC